ncbi:ciliary microtubule associated protein 1A-like [Ruditapes philippinarum]|uniref:ciliary microtubule associated protein 1A-like n=1 Tax=Ruditapes philippinarum TaxID=129788 RepID=UPI00295BE32C|nr:ciliary microtubule associated protein 1A-like [Ruditapes philippinarum]
MQPKSKYRPIEGRVRGPGPGRYGLPSTVGYEAHDATKRMEPAYSFGRRLHYADEKKASPGPAYFVHPQMTRNGKDGTPSYSLLSRHSELRKFKTPASSAYYPEKVHPQGEKIAPKYSIGLRTRFRKLDHNPSPSNYMLPTVLGPAQPSKTSTPSYSIPGRSKIGCYLEDLANAPGPGHTKKVENDVYMSRAPNYSLRNRCYMPQDNVKKPGPGAHYPEKVEISRAKAPSYSLGVRHAEFVCPLIA